MFGFNFFDMDGNHEERKVKNTVIGEAVIDTAAVTDSEQPYETGIQHPRYNDGAWVIVELYDPKEEAVLGHKKWCKLFKNGNLPPHLEDVSSCGIKQLMDAFGYDESIKELSADQKKK